MSSGDIHSGVPITVERFVWLATEAETPRSHSLMPPPLALLSSTLPALMSRCRICRSSCRWCSPLTMAAETTAISSSVSGARVTRRT